MVVISCVINSFDLHIFFNVVVFIVDISLCVLLELIVIKTKTSSTLLFLINTFALNSSIYSICNYVC